MEFMVRPGVEDDMQALFSLSRDELGYDCPLPVFSKNLKERLQSDSDRIFVAVAKGYVVGYIHACTYALLYYPPMKNVMGLAVHHAYRRKGIGTALLREVETWAKETGAMGVRLSSGAEREQAHQFYRQCGYTGEKLQRRFIKKFE